LQCTSAVGPGGTISYMSRTSVTRTVTVNGADRTSHQTTVQSTNVAASTVVRSRTATVYAVPVNGFNIVERQGSGTESSTPSSTATNPPEQSGSSGLSPGAIAGISVGAAIGTGLLALGAFLVWKARKRRAVNQQPEGVAPVGEDGRKDDYHYMQVIEPSQPPSEMPVKTHVHELSHRRSMQELPG
jgi:hypothetical protein